MLRIHIMKKSDYLGYSTIEQITIDSPVDQKKIEMKLLNLLDSIRLAKDKFSQDLFISLKKNNKINFNLNKHEEIYCNSINDINYLFQYLIFRRKFRLSGEKKISFKNPLYLLIEPVSSCNLRCPFCFQTDKSFTRKPYMGIMKWKLFKKAIDEADDIGVGAITVASRGEPTMHKKFGEMLKYISTKKNIFELKTNTNATFLNEKMCHQIFESNVNQIVISADHYIKSDYERLRKGAKFEKVVKNVDLLYAIRKKYYPSSITEIRVSGIDDDRNLNREKFKNFWIKRSDHVTAGYPVERTNTYNNKVHPDINDPCENLWDRMYIWFDGIANPCDADYKSYLSYGNLNHNSITEIWNSKKLQELRNKHLENKRKNIDPCNKCGVTFN